MDLKRVVVTGLGTVNPLGNSIPEFWENAIAGVSGAAPITNFDTNAIQTKVKFGCQVKNFDIAEYMDRKEARKLDKYSHFAVASAVQAIKDSALDLEKEDLNRIGVILGFGIGGVDSFEEGVDTIHEQKKLGQELKVTPFFVPRILGSIAAGLISIMYAEAALGDCGVTGFGVMHALSTRNDSPETASRPMSASRDGFVLGEGGGILILEEYEHAVARGAKIYAEVAGWGATADAYHMTAPDPEGNGAIRVMQEAIQDAGMQPSDIDYVNMHGTSTPLGDIAECKAIKAVFGEHVYDMNLSSTKSMTGHLLGGAGVIEAIATVLAVKNDIVPPTINHEEGDEDEQIDYRMNFTFNKAQKREVRAGLSNTFGFGGHNSCVIFKKFKD